MALFRMRWLRKLVRRNTNRIPHNTAHTWRQRLSLGYMFLAWNTFGYVCYAVYTGRTDWDWAKHHGLKSEEELRLSSGQQFARMLKIDNAKIFRISGFRKVAEFDDNIYADNEYIETEENAADESKIFDE